MLPVTVTVPGVVGVPDTVQVTIAPTGTVPGDVHAPFELIVQPSTLTPAGNPLTPHVAFTAAAVAPALLVHVKLPL